MATRSSKFTKAIAHVDKTIDSPVFVDAFGSNWGSRETEEDYVELVAGMGEQQFEELFKPFVSYETAVELLVLCHRRQVPEKWLKRHWNIWTADVYMSAVQPEVYPWMIESDRLELMTILMLRADKFKRSDATQVKARFNELKHQKTQNKRLENIERKINDAYEILVPAGLVVAAVILVVVVWFADRLGSIDTNMEHVTFISAASYKTAQELHESLAVWPFSDWFTAFIEMWIKGLECLLGR